MSASRLLTWQRATALVPLALLSGAWTASLTVTSTASAASAGQDGTLPDGTTVPSEAIEAPASVSTPGEIAPGVPAGSVDAIVDSASPSGIPAAALAAYQRAAEVLDSADPSCNLTWPLLAAIGRVESDHGRYGGSTLTDDGVSTPGIFGIPLDGSSGTAQVSDTDAGALDEDKVYDRAVGPMQFIPSTWSVVGVDGDGDGMRNPQDIDDASLAAAVYLCSGEEDLATEQGLRSAVYRYNHSDAYVDLVLSIMAAYARGDFSSVPNGSFAPTTFVPADDDAVLGFGTSGTEHGKPARSDGGKGAGRGSGGDADGSGGDAGGGGSSDGGGLPSVSGPDDGGGNGGGGVKETVEDTTDEVTDTVKDTLTPLEKAQKYCQDNSGPLGLQACVDAYLEGGAQAVQNAIDSLTDPVDDVLGGGGDDDGDGGGILGGLG